MRDLRQVAEVAESAAREAGAAILGWYRKSYTVHDKGGDSPVTNADLAANRILYDRLTRSCSEFGWLSEESADAPARHSFETLWVVDPLDGTRDFILGTDEFAVSVGLVHRGRPVLGVVYLPPLDLLYTGIAGHGAWRNGVPIRSSTRSELSGARLVVSRSECEREGLGETVERMGLKEAIRAGSAALKMARVAEGQAEAYVTLTPKNAWDFCAGEAILSEAGGRITDAFGETFAHNRAQVRIPDLVASNGAIHDSVLRSFEPYVSLLDRANPGR
jgi:myo-inositol-1(or 4)-monophosphatase